MRDFVGVIGGMGPDATVLFMDVLAGRTLAGRDQEHLNVDCLQHCSIPDRTDYILDHTKPSPLPDLLEDIQLLNERGAKLIAIPCNTAHFFYKDLAAASTAPVLNMIELTAHSVREQFPGAKRVAILGTRGTVNSGLYHKALSALGLEPVTPSEPVQQEVDHIIFDQVKGNSPLSEGDYNHAVATALQDADVAIVGCTELSVPEQKFGSALPTVDALVTLAEATITGAGFKLAH